MGTATLVVENTVERTESKAIRIVTAVLNVLFVIDLSLNPVVILFHALIHVYIKAVGFAFVT